MQMNYCITDKQHINEASAIYFDLWQRQVA